MISSQIEEWFEVRVSRGTGGWAAIWGAFKELIQTPLSDEGITYDFVVVEFGLPTTQTPIVGVDLTREISIELPGQALTHVTFSAFITWHAVGELLDAAVSTKPDDWDQFRVDGFGASSPNDAPFRSPAEIAEEVQSLAIARAAANSDSELIEVGFGLE